MKLEAIAYLKGYRYFNGSIIGLKNKPLKTPRGSNGYPCFGVKINKKNFKISCHRFVAYQKFGDSIYRDGIVVRHLDGNKDRYEERNISIGSQSDNMMDVPGHIRLEKSIYASSHIRKFSDNKVEFIRKFYNECKSYKKTMCEFNIKSKGSLWYILNNDYKTTT